MAKYKHYDYNQSVLIPISLEDQIIPGTLEFAIHTLVDERIDASIFDERYRNDETGRWGLRSQDSVEGSAVCLFTGIDFIEEDREGVQRERDVYGAVLRPTT